MEKKIQDPSDIEYICKLYAEEVGPTRICELLKEKSPEKYPTIYRSNIYAITNDPDNGPIIQKYKQAFLANIMEVGIANKRIRLNDLDKIRKQILNTLENCVDDKGTVKLTETKRYLALTKRLVDIEIQGREEVEKKPDFLDMFKRIGPLADKTDEELLAYERELTIKISAYKTSARPGIPVSPCIEVGLGEGAQGADQAEPS